MSSLPSPPLIPGDLDTSALQSSQLALSGATLGTVVIKPSVVTVSYALTLPNAQGAANTLLRNDGSGYLSWVAPGTGGTGDVVGPASSTDTALALFSGTTGKIIQNSVVTLSSLGAMTGVASLALKGTTNSVTISPAAATTAYSITLPGAQGAARTFLENDGTGVLRWAGGDGFAWNANQSSPISGQTINGVLSGTTPAYYDGIVLGLVFTVTGVAVSRSGFVNWNIVGFDFTRNFRLLVSYYMSTGSDGIQYGFGGSGPFSGTATANGGILNCYSTGTFSPSTSCTFYRNGVLVSPPGGNNTGVTYLNKWTTDIIEVRWVGPKRIGTLYHSSDNWQNAIDLTTWVPGGTYIYVGATTNTTLAPSSDQNCKAVSLEYI